MPHNNYWKNKNPTGNLLTGASGVSTIGLNQGGLPAQPITGANQTWQASPIGLNQGNAQTGAPYQNRRFTVMPGQGAYRPQQQNQSGGAAGLNHGSQTPQVQPWGGAGPYNPSYQQQHSIGLNQGAQRQPWSGVPVGLNQGQQPHIGLNQGQQTWSGYGAPVFNPEDYGSMTGNRGW